MEAETTILRALESDSINTYTTNLQENVKISYPDLWEAIKSLSEQGLITHVQEGGPDRIYLTAAAKWALAHMA